MFCVVDLQSCFGMQNIFILLFLNTGPLLVWTKYASIIFACDALNTLVAINFHLMIWPQVCSFDILCLERKQKKVEKNSDGT